jgi:phosphatidylserine decarboxylase
MLTVHSHGHPGCTYTPQTRKASADGFVRRNNESRRAHWEHWRCSHLPIGALNVNSASPLWDEGLSRGSRTCRETLLTDGATSMTSSPPILLLRGHNQRRWRPSKLSSKERANLFDESIISSFNIIFDSVLFRFKFILFKYYFLLELFYFNCKLLYFRNKYLIDWVLEQKKED